MIYTLTLNPAIDRTIYVDRINEKDVTRVKKTLRDAAGKGINVSKVLNQLGQKSVCLGFVAGENGKYIEESLTKQNITTDLITVSGETRENIKLISLEENRILEINESGPHITNEDIKTLFNLLDESLKAGDYLVISGSVPNGVPKTIYSEIIKEYPFVTVILDVAGEMFDKSIKAKPSIIKPNIYELELYAKKELKTLTETLEVCNELLDKGIENIFLSLGKDGAMLISEKETFLAKVPELEAKSTVGAGDSFLAGMVKALNEKKTPLETLVYAASVGSASVLSEGTASVKPEDVIYLQSRIVLEKK